MNNLRASQAIVGGSKRLTYAFVTNMQQLSTNQLADTVEELFENDYNFEQQYHTLLNGELNFQL